MFSIRGLEEKAAENAKKTKERQMRHLDERARLLAEVATTTHSSCFEMSGLEMELQALENKYESSDVEDGDDSTYCVACNKQLRSERAYSNHLKQKKHRENVAALRELLMEDSTIVAQEIDVKKLQLELDDIESSTNKRDQSIDINQTAASSFELCADSTASKAGAKKAKKERKNRSQVRYIATNEHQEENKKLLEGPNMADTNQSSDVEVTELSNQPMFKNEIETSAHTTLSKDRAGAVDGRKKKKSRRKNKVKIEMENSSGDEANSSKIRCAVCATTFESKNKLFNHLKTAGHAIHIK